ncbi:MAG: SDR family oxidoreductase [bacterium]
MAEETRTRWSDMHAYVTGGNSGIGRAISVCLAEKGVDVAICGQNQETINSTVDRLQELNPSCFGKQVDVRSEDEQLTMFDELKSRFETLEICVPNAGRATLANVTDTTLEEWNRDIETNLTGFFLTAREALKWMKGQEKGWILPIVSKAGKKAFELRASYCSSKWGALGLSKCLALEAEEYGIKVSALCPASVDTPYQEGNPRGTDWMMEPEEIAKTVVFLIQQNSNVKINELLIENFQKPN